MRERRIGIRELEANPRTLLHEVRSGTTLVLTDRGHAVARLTGVSGANDAEPSPIAWSGRRLKKTKPKAHLQGGGSMHREGEPQVTLLYVDTSALFKRYVEEDDQGRRRHHHADSSWRVDRREGGCRVVDELLRYRRHDVPAVVARTRRERVQA